MKHLYISLIAILLFSFSTITSAQDLTPPVALCQDITLYLDSMGNGPSITVADIDSGSYDNLVIDTMFLSQYHFDCSDLPSATVTLYVYDLAGNVDSCHSIVTVMDTIAPDMSSTCNDTTIYLYSGGGYFEYVYEFLNGQLPIDNCSGEIFSATWAENTTFRIPPPLPSIAFDCSNVGQNEVTIFSSDGNGNTGSCSMMVTVIDTHTTAQANCRPPITRTLNSNGYVNVNPYYLSYGTNCIADTITYSQLQFTCADIGVNDVVVTVIDTFGNISTCTTQVTILDTFSLATDCRDASLNLNVDGIAVLTPGQVLVGSPCGFSSIELSQDTFDCSDVGSNNVTLTLTDTLGNVQTCSSVVTVADNINPTIECRDTTIYFDEDGQAQLPAGLLLGASDACGIQSITEDGSSLPSSVIHNYNCYWNQSGQVFTYEVTDIYGNSSTCASTLTLLDTTPPELICYNDTFYLSQNVVNYSSGPYYYEYGNEYFIYYYTSDYDNCDHNYADVYLIDVRGVFIPPIPPLPPPPDYIFNCTEIGVNEVLIGATDSDGNTSTCTSIITVMDTMGPAFIFPNDTLTLCTNNPGGAYANFDSVYARDHCGVDTMWQSAGLPHNVIYPMGITVNTYHAIDIHGNSSTGSFVVNVIPGDPPLADFSYTGSGCVGSVYDFSSSAADSTYTYLWNFGNNVAGWGMNRSYTYNHPGTYDVTLRVTNEAGCVSTSAPQTIVVEPQPTLSLTATDATCGNTNDGSITATASGNSSLTYSLDGGTFSANNIFNGLVSGYHTVTVMNANGCTNTDSIYIDNPGVSSLNITNSINVDCSQDQDGSINVTASGGTPPYLYSIDGGNNHASGAFNYLSGGEHTISVVDANGCMYTELVTIGVNTETPIADFSFTLNGLSFGFTNTSSFASSYFWDFGDGNTSSEQYPTHAYADNGAYYVTLIVSNACGSDTIGYWLNMIGIGFEDVEDGTLIILSPNPNDGSFSLQIEAAEAFNNPQLRIWTVEGRLVASEQLNASGKTLKSNFNYDLSAGIYTLEVLTGEKAYRKQLVVR